MKNKTNFAPAKHADKRTPQSFVEAAASFEESKAENSKRLSKFALRVAGVSIVLAFLGVTTGLLGMLLRPEPTVVILRVDDTTGATTELRSLRDNTDKYDEVVNKYWLSQYVRYCESYDWYTISDQLESCKLMSEESIGKEREKNVRAPNAPLNLLKDKGKVVVKISSIVFIGDSAQVRFTSEKLNTSGENVDNSPVQKWIATVVYQFKPKKLTEQQRLVNPLGLDVVSYRVDPEVVK